MTIFLFVIGMLAGIGIAQLVRSMRLTVLQGMFVVSFGFMLAGGTFGWLFAQASGSACRTNDFVAMVGVFAVLVAINGMHSLYQAIVKEQK